MVYIQSVSLLVAYSSYLAAAVLCLMPYALPSFLECCSAGSADLLVLGSSGSHSYYCCFCYSTVLGSFNPFYTMTFCYACWDSLSGFVLACWDSVASFPGL